MQQKYRKWLIDKLRDGKVCIHNPNPSDASSLKTNPISYILAEAGIPGLSTGTMSYYWIEKRPSGSLDYGSSTVQPEDKTSYTPDQFLYPTKVTDLLYNEVIHCKTEEEAVALCKIMDDAGLEWAGGSSYIDKTQWNLYKEDTCYMPQSGQYGSIQYCAKNFNIVYEASDFITTTEATERNYCRFKTEAEFIAEYGTGTPSTTKGCASSFVKSMKYLYGLEWDWDKVGENQNCYPDKTKGVFIWDISKDMLTYKPLPEVHPAIEDKPDSIPRFNIRDYVQLASGPCGYIVGFGGTRITSGKVLVFVPEGGGHDGNGILTIDAIGAEVTIPEEYKGHLLWASEGIVELRAKVDTADWWSSLEGRYIKLLDEIGSMYYQKGETHLVDKAFPTRIKFSDSTIEEGYTVYLQDFIVVPKPSSKSTVDAQSIVTGTISAWKVDPTNPEYWTMYDKLEDGDGRKFRYAGSNDGEHYIEVMFSNSIVGYPRHGLPIPQNYIVQNLGRFYKLGTYSQVFGSVKKVAPGSITLKVEDPGKGIWAEDVPTDMPKPTTVKDYNILSSDHLVRDLTVSSNSGNLLTEIPQSKPQVDTSIGKSTINIIEPYKAPDLI